MQPDKNVPPRRGGSAMASSGANTRPGYEQTALTVDARF